MEFKIEERGKNLRRLTTEIRSYENTLITNIINMKINADRYFTAKHTRST